MIGYESFFQAQLTAGIDETATNIPLDNIPTPSEGFLVIEPLVPAKREIIYYTSKDGSSVTVPSGVGNGRGYDGTTATAHSQNADVIMAPVGAMFSTLQDGTAIADGAVTDQKLAHNAEQVLQYVPGASVDFGSTTLGDWFTIGSATVPSWATKARVTISINYFYPITATNTMEAVLVFGSVSGVTRRLYATGHAINDPMHCSWTEDITLSGSGSQTVKVQAQRITGANGVRIDTASDISLHIRYIP
jgi:hypothetical protein